MREIIQHVRIRIEAHPSALTLFKKWCVASYIDISCSKIMILLTPCGALTSSYLECLPSYTVIIKLHFPVHFSHIVQFSSAGLMASHDYLMSYTIIGCCRIAWSNSAWHICSLLIIAGTENVLASTLGDTIFKLSTADLKFK